MKRPPKDIIFDEAYEERLVAFVDVLGWQAHIEESLKKPERLPWLRAHVEAWSYFSKRSHASSQNIKISSFSDNLVVSLDTKRPEALIERLGEMQILAAVAGLWLRGGVTIGKIIHRSTCVFGPGLNRAYELEKNVAEFPRIVVDEELAGRLLDFPLVVREGAVSFIDPWRLPFVDALGQARLASWGTKRTILTIGANIREEFSKKLEEKESRKLIWLYDRLVKNFSRTEFKEHFPLPDGIDLGQLFKR